MHHESLQRKGKVYDKLRIELELKGLLVGNGSRETVGIKKYNRKAAKYAKTIRS